MISNGRKIKNIEKRKREIVILRIREIERMKKGEKIKRERDRERE